MKPITHNRQSYLIDGKPVYLMSGEFHYYRVPKQDWRTRMRLFKAAGGNVLATYIPWLIHEPQEGHFDFSSETWLHLEDFLTTAREENLYVIARPGPYQYSELVYDGLPGWLVKDYPQVLARNIRGETFRESSISYLHPLFLEKARAWFDVVCPILTRHTVDRGGAIAYVQLDNEMIGIHEWFGTLDYNADTMGFHQADGRYPRFLQARYAHVNAINQAYRADYAKFEDVHPGDPSKDAAVAYRRRKDYYEFYVQTIAEYSTTLASWIRAHDIYVPLVHNSGNPGMNPHFLETAAALGDQYLLGSDHYYNLSQEWPQNNPTPQYAARVFVSLEELRLMGYPPTVYEIPSGSAANWPPITPPDALACYLTNLAFGMRGSNYYIFTGGPNPPGAGKSTDLYDYGAGIGAKGEIRPLYHAQVEFGNLIAERPWLADATRPHDLRLALDFDHARADNYWKEAVGDLYAAHTAWDLLRRGPLTASLCAGLSPAFVDLGDDAWTNDATTPLLVVCASSMSRAKQERLAGFLRAGGRALFMPVLPTVDENLNPCTVLLQALGLEGFQPAFVEQVHPTVAGIANVLGTACFCSAPQGAKVLGQDDFTGKPLAWQRDFLGGGSAVFVGLSWSYSMNEQRAMLVRLLENLGLQPVLTCTNPNVWVTYWEGQGHACLFALNLFTAPMEAEITVNWAGRAYSTGALTFPPVSVQVIDLV